MIVRSLTSRGKWLALLVGVLTAAVLAAFSLTLRQLGMSPFPQPVGLAFADALLGRSLPLPVGLLFHLVYVAFWSYLFIAFFRRTFLNALWLGLGLALVVLVVFFPYIGWGLFGLAIGPKVAVAAVMVHVLFAIVLWGFVRWLFGKTPSAGAPETA